jgi:hypoxanthine-guanine phosphoribosyltransferase
MQGAHGGWFIPAKPTANGGLTAFVEPFLDVNKITEDTKDLLKTMVPRTTDDWENFMSVCHKEWDELEAQGLDNIEEDGGGGDEDEMDEDEEEEREHDLWEGNMALRSPPEDFAWEHKLEDMSLKDELERGYPQNTKEAVEELQAAFGDLEGMVVESHRGSRKDASDVLNHLGLSVAEIVTAINRINRRGRRMVSLVGSVEDLREETGRHDVTLVEAVLGLGKAIDKLTTTLAEVDEDLVHNCTLLDNKTQVLERKQRAIGNTGPSPSSLTMSTPIFDDNGVQVSTLGRVLQDNIDLSCSNKLLKGRIEQLSADVIARGGVTLGNAHVHFQDAAPRTVHEGVPQGR